MASSDVKCILKPDEPKYLQAEAGLARGEGELVVVATDIFRIDPTHGIAVGRSGGVVRSVDLDVAVELHGIAAPERGLFGCRRGRGGCLGGSGDGRSGGGLGILCLLQILQPGLERLDQGGLLRKLLLEQFQLGLGLLFRVR